MSTKIWIVEPFRENTNFKDGFQDILRIIFAKSGVDLSSFGAKFPFLDFGSGYRPAKPAKPIPASDQVGSLVDQTGLLCAELPNQLG